MVCNDKLSWECVNHLRGCGVYAWCSGKGTNAVIKQVRPLVDYKVFAWQFLYVIVFWVIMLMGHRTPNKSLMNLCIKAVSR